jgi:hypothetical protein
MPAAHGVTGGAFAAPLARALGASTRQRRAVCSARLRSAPHHVRQRRRRSLRCGGGGHQRVGCSKRHPSAAGRSVGGFSTGTILGLRSRSAGAGACEIVKAVLISLAQQHPEPRPLLRELNRERHRDAVRPRALLRRGDRRDEEKSRGGPHLHERALFLGVRTPFSSIDPQLRCPAGRLRAPVPAPVCVLLPRPLPRRAVSFCLGQWASSFSTLSSSRTHSRGRPAPPRHARTLLS